MGFKKKRNILFVTVLFVSSYFFYQMYIYFKISTSDLVIVQQEDVKSYILKKTDEDKFINSKGVIRGILASSMHRYKPDRNGQFKCLKTEQTIPHQYLNDDYCDCEDHSDEPSTNACVEGIFYCDTQLRRKPISMTFVWSSRVNDGICDCCDGSDEWFNDSPSKLASGKCLNRCY